jgi:hypothetical protein
VRAPLFPLLLLVLAGCSTVPPSESTTDAPTSSSPTFPSPHTESRTFSFVAGAGQPGAMVQYPDFRAGSFQVPANVTALVIEAQWTCTTPSCTYTLHYAGPDGNDHVGPTGSGAANVTVDAVEPGNWGIALFPETVAGDTKGETRLTWFFGPVPPGFTAFP